MAEAPVTIGGFRDEEPQQGSITQEYARAHQLIHDVNERMFATQLAHSERLSDLSIKVAHASVQLLTVVAEANATILGKSVNGKEVSDSILEILQKIKSQFTGEGPKQ